MNLVSLRYGLVCLATAALSAPDVCAQGLVPNGGFELGAENWSNVLFDDPAGSFGVASADVTGAGASPALFADFVSPTSRTHSDWQTALFMMPGGRWPVSFAVMWQKSAAMPIPDPANSWIEVQLVDRNGLPVFSAQVPAPQQSGLLDRATFAGHVVVTSPGQYRAQVSMQHSASSQMAFRAWIDDLVVGSAGWHLGGDGCPGTGGHVPMVTANGAPQLGSPTWTVYLSHALAPSTAWLAIGAGTTSWSGTPLPFDAGGGCMLRVGIQWTFVNLVVWSGAGNGTSVGSVPLVPNPALRGVPVHAQWLVRDAGSGSPFGLAMTPLLSTTFQ